MPDGLVDAVPNLQAKVVLAGYLMRNLGKDMGLSSGKVVKTLLREPWLVIP